MNIDERLEKLTERHEALVQWTELKSRSDQGRQEAITQSVELLTHDIRQLGAEVKVINGIVSEIVKGINGLVAIARSHEHRISALEA